MSNTAAKRKEKGIKENQKSTEKPKDVEHFLLSQNFDFSACPSQNVIKRDISGKNGELSCCNCIFDQIKAYLAEIQPENRQNVQKTRFFAKSSGSQWVKDAAKKIILSHNLVLIVRT